MPTSKISLDQVRDSLSVVFQQIDCVLVHIPHCLVIPITRQFQSVLAEYELIQLDRNRFLEGPPIFEFKDTCLRNLRDVLATAHGHLKSEASLQPAIDELNFLITSEILIRTD
jgi:hypothetical protein